MIVRTCAGRADARVIVAEGPIDGNTYSAFSGALDESARSGGRFVLVDASKVTHFSSAAIGIAIDYRGKFLGIGGSLAFLRLPADVRKVFDLLGLSRFFVLASSEEEALAGAENAVRTDQGEGGYPLFVLTGDFSLPTVRIEHQYGCVMCDQAEVEGIAVPVDGALDADARRQVERFARRRHRLEPWPDGADAEVRRRRAEICRPLEGMLAGPEQDQPEAYEAFDIEMLYPWLRTRFRRVVHPDDFQPFGPTPANAFAPLPARLPGLRGAVLLYGNCD